MWLVPVHDESMWNIHPLQVRRVMFWYTEEVQVMTLLLITDLKYTNDIISYPIGQRTAVSLTDNILSSKPKDKPEIGQ